MTPANLRSLIAELGLTQAGFARMVGVEARTVRNWLAGKAVPGPMVMLHEALSSGWRPEGWEESQPPEKSP